MHVRSELMYDSQIYERKDKPVNLIQKETIRQQLTSIVAQNHSPE
jgi:hypothetical protein